MGVDIVLYRKRIGVFNACCRPSRKNNQKRDKHDKYTRFNRDSDVHYRVFLMMILFGLQLIAIEGLALWIRNLECVSQGAESFCSSTTFGDINPNTLYHTITIPLNYECPCQYSSYHQRLLLLSADVELNPGPLTDKEEILEAISASREDVLREMKSVKDDIKSIKQEVAGIRTEQKRVKSDISDIHKIQHDMEVRIATLETDVKSLKRSNKRLEDENEILHLDVDEISEELDKKTAIIENLDKDVDRLEAYSRRDTIRVFGLPEMVNETYDKLKGYVISSVLNVACPHFDWGPEDIVRTHRVGKQDASNVENPRILLIKFLHWDRKMAVLRGRETLREYGIRVGDDITRRQRDTLKRLSEKGMFGYYYKGELFVREKTGKQNENSEGNPSAIQSRTFVKANRKTVIVPDTVTPEASANINGYEYVSDAGHGEDDTMTVDESEGDK